MLLREVAKRLAALVATVLTGGFLGGALVVLAPGFGVDERELDPRLSEQSLQALRAEGEASGNLLRSYSRFVTGMLRGDLGESRALNRPVRSLLAERIGTTAELIVAGMAGGWALGLLLALPAALWRRPALDMAAGMTSGLFLSIPAAVIALALFLFEGPVRFAIALVIFPRVFRYARNLWAEANGLPHVLIARARGLAPHRIFAFHILPWAAPQLLALAGVSLSIAIGAAIPIEVICDLPGVGQLAWKAALARDLPVLISLTAIITAVTLTANMICDLAAAAWRPGRP